ncbi:MAG: NapC/NirT family cytochrome c [Chromatiaceae bacterium]|jgi:cytochrome c-type protein NapC
MANSSKRLILSAGLVGVALGVLGALAAEKVHHYTSSDAFCGTTCHSMEAYVATDPAYTTSAHRTSWTGVHAGCADCHIPEMLLPATWAHIRGGIKDSIAEATNDFTDPSVWESRRAELAYAVRDWLVETDSATCRRCHSDESAIDPGFRRGRREHKMALQEGITCIVCHYNLVHSPVEPREKLLRLARGKGDQ